MRLLQLVTVCVAWVTAATTIAPESLPHGAQTRPAAPSVRDAQKARAPIPGVPAAARALAAETSTVAPSSSAAFTEEHSLVLSDADFEHLTQASTGATTGDWFVKFYAPWCGHCKRMAPEWEKLASEAKGYNVARVDCTKNPGLARRFGIRGFPTLLFFHKGQMYKYVGPRTAEALDAFALEGFRSLDGVPVPKLPGVVDKALAAINAAVVQIRVTLEKHEAFLLSPLGLALAAGTGAVISLSFIFLCCRRPRRKTKNQ